MFLQALSDARDQNGNNISNFLSPRKRDCVVSSIVLTIIFQICSHRFERLKFLGRSVASTASILRHVYDFVKLLRSNRIIFGRGLLFSYWKKGVSILIPLAHTQRFNTISRFDHFFFLSSFLLFSSLIEQLFEKWTMNLLGWMWSWNINFGENILKFVRTETGFVWI